MRTAIIIMSLAAAILTVPSVAAEDEPVCVDELGACLDPELCLGLTGTCLDPQNPKPGLIALWEWIKDQLGPCTCPPMEPWG